MKRDEAIIKAAAAVRETAKAFTEALELPPDPVPEPPKPSTPEELTSIENCLRTEVGWMEDGIDCHYSAAQKHGWADTLRRFTASPLYAGKTAQEWHAAWEAITASRDGERTYKDEYWAQLNTACAERDALQKLVDAQKPLTPTARQAAEKLYRETMRLSEEYCGDARDAARELRTILDDEAKSEPTNLTGTTGADGAADQRPKAHGPSAPASPADYNCPATNPVTGGKCVKPRGHSGQHACRVDNDYWTWDIPASPGTYGLG